jgi:hypothetical protein
VCDLVIQESFFLRDDSNPEERVQIDLQEYLDCGVLEFCELSNEGEIEMYVDLASTLDDGEAKSLAIALSRGLAVVTDDRKARRIFAEMGGEPANLLSTADIVRAWAEETELDNNTLRVALTQIQIRSRFIPRATDPNHSWWQRSANPSSSSLEADDNSGNF